MYFFSAWKIWNLALKELSATFATEMNKLKRKRIKKHNFFFKAKQL